MTLKQGLGAGLGVLLALAASFAAGRYSKPDKIVTIREKGEVRVEYKDRIVYRDRKTKTKTTSTTTKVPDGAETTTTTTETETDTKTTNDTETKTTTKTTETEKSVVENKKPDWRVTGMVGLAPGQLSLDMRGLQPLYGLQVDRRIAGTIWGGVWVITRPQDLSGSTVIGIHLALEF